MIKHIYRYLRNKFLILNQKRNRKNILFGKRIKIDSKCKFEGYNSFGINNFLSNCVVGRGTYTGNNVELKSVIVGRFCSLGSNIRNTTGNHPTNTFISTHPSFFSTGKAAGFTFSKQQKFKELNYIKDHYLVEIGNDVWIGDNVSILDGIKIGDGAIIGTGSLVTKNIEPYSINVGVPAKKIKYRFSDEEIDSLLKLRWWNKDLKWIEEHAKHFDNIEKISYLYK